ncbi:hypothetical protein YC2023_035567 [Brassica napus]
MFPRNSVGIFRGNSEKTQNLGFLGISSEIPREIPRISFSVGMSVRIPMFSCSGRGFRLSGTVLSFLNIFSNAWLFLLNRNSTLLKVKAWNQDTDRKKSIGIAGLVCASKSGFQVIPRVWDQVVQWLLSLPRNSPAIVAIIQFWTSVIYKVWKERNRRRLHDRTTLS